MFDMYGPVCDFDAGSYCQWCSPMRQPVILQCGVNWSRRCLRMLLSMEATYLFCSFALSMLPSSQTCISAC